MGKDNQPTLEELQAQLAQVTEEKERAIKARDTISEDYRMQRSEADKLKDFVGKTRKVLEEKGVAKFDDNYNITIIEKKQDAVNQDLQTYNNELQTVQAKMDALNEKFNAGEIDPDKFAKENVKLLREENTIARKIDSQTLKAEILERQRLDNEAAETRRAQQTAEGRKALEISNFTDRLAKEFPEHMSAGGLPDPNSELVKEVNALLAANPDLYPAPAELNTNMKERYKIFKDAQLSLISKGKLNRDDIVRRQRAASAQFNTLDSGEYNPDNGKNKQSTFMKESVAGNYVTNKFGKDTISGIDKAFKSYEDTGTMVIES